MADETEEFKKEIIAEEAAKFKDWTIESLKRQHYVERIFSDLYKKEMKKYKNKVIALEARTIEENIIEPCSQKEKENENENEIVGDEDDIPVSQRTKNM